MLESKGMNEEKKTGVTFNGSVTFNGPMFDIHDNQQVTIVNKTKADEKAHPKTITDKEIKIAIEETDRESACIRSTFYACTNDCRVFEWGYVNGNTVSDPQEVFLKK